jgi:hypothetical protein
MKKTNAIGIDSEGTELSHHHQLWKYRRVVILQSGCCAQFFPSSKESSVRPKIGADENKTETSPRIKDQ